MILFATFSRGPSPDIAGFRQPLERASRNAKIRTVLADASYDSESNHTFAREELCIRTVIPAKHGRPTTKPAKGKYRRLMQQRFDNEKYGQRWQVETVVSMIKRRLGTATWGRRYWSQDRDLFLMVLTHNIMILRRLLQGFLQSRPVPFYGRIPIWPIATRFATLRGEYEIGKGNRSRWELVMHEVFAREFMQHFPERETVRLCEEQVRAAAHAYPYSILVACMPKSGSTFLANVLAAASGYPQHPLVYTHQRQEQDLYFPSLMKAIAIPTITQQHVRATNPNLELIQLFHLRPVVLVRNIFDVVVSFFDHLHQESIEVPAAYFNHDFFTLDERSKFDMIIDMVMPWYFGFFASWHEAAKNGRCTFAWITYELLFANPLTAVREILGFCGVDGSDEKIGDALQLARGKGSRMNEGVRGRGQERLSETQRLRIGDYTHYYPSIDFSMIGIAGNVDSKTNSRAEKSA